MSVVLCAVLAIAPAAAQDVQPGLDLFTTPAPPPSETTAGTMADFSAAPLPAGFFCPAGPPFFGTINFQGSALNQYDFRWFGTDTVVRRLDVATLPGPGSQDTIPIEIVALSLVSVNPIQVSCPPPNDLWNVKVCLSTATSQPTGTMTIHKENAQGGTFSSDLPVFPRFIFTNPSTFEIKEFDAGLSPVPVLFSSNNGNWVYSPSSELAVITVPPGVSVDGNCDGTIETLSIGSSNFAAGVAWQHPVIPGWAQDPVVYSVTRVAAQGEGMLQPDAGHPPPNDLYALDHGPFATLLHGAELFQSSGAVLGAAPDMTNVNRLSASWGVSAAPGAPPFMGPFLPSPGGSVQTRSPAPEPPGTLGLVPSDELDALSFGRDGGSVLIFSVRNDADGLPGTAVEFHASISPEAPPLGGSPSNGGGDPGDTGGESAGDLYSSAVFGLFGGVAGPPFAAPAALGGNLLYLDEVDLGLQAPSLKYDLLGPSEDDLDAVEVSDAAVVDGEPNGIPDYGDKLVFFSLGPVSPSLVAPTTPDDILVSTGGFLGAFAIYADGASNIGLLAGDNLNALVLWDTGGFGCPAGAPCPNGFVDFGDEALFTLAPGSPSLAAGANPNMPAGPHAPGDVFHTAFVAAPGGITLYASAADLGLDGNDVIDALDIGSFWGIVGGPPPDIKTMTKEQAALARHYPQTPQCQIQHFSQCINADRDGDNVPDDADNAPFQRNHLQEDTDHDLVGDVADNCVTLSNADQADQDGDHFGDACDNCPLLFNPTQDSSLCAPPLYLLEQTTINLGGKRSTSASYLVDASVGQESVIEAGASASYLLQSGFWSFHGMGLVPVVVTVSPAMLSWTGNSPPYFVYRSTDCSAVGSSLLATVSGNSHPDPSLPALGQVFCYRVDPAVPAQ